MACAVPDLTGMAALRRAGGPAFPKLQGRERSGQRLRNPGRLFKYSVQQVIKCSCNKLVVAQDGDLGAGTYMNLAELATRADRPRAKGNRAQVH